MFVGLNGGLMMILMGFTTFEGYLPPDSAV